MERDKRRALGRAEKKVRKIEKGGVKKRPRRGTIEALVPAVFGPISANPANKIVSKNPGDWESFLAEEYTPQQAVICMRTDKFSVDETTDEVFDYVLRKAGIHEKLHESAKATIRKEAEKIIRDLYHETVGMK